MIILNTQLKFSIHSGLLVSNRQYGGVRLTKISDKFKN